MSVKLLLLQSVLKNSLSSKKSNTPKQNLQFLFLKNSMLKIPVTLHLHHQQILLDWKILCFSYIGSLITTDTIGDSEFQSDPFLKKWQVILVKTNMLDIATTIFWIINIHRLPQDFIELLTDLHIKHIVLSSHKLWITCYLPLVNNIIISGIFLLKKEIQIISWNI